MPFTSGTSRYGASAVLMVKIACRSIFMGNMEVPTTNQQVVKMPLGTYEFGANLVSNQVSGTAWMTLHIMFWVQAHAV